MREAKRKSHQKDAKTDATPTDEAAAVGGEASQKDLWSEFQERFPNLAAEMEESSAAVRIDGVRWQESDRAKTVEMSQPARFAKYEPDIIDFVRRCGTEEEALEIITFMEQRGEIDGEHARALRHQLRARGLRSFGSKKTWGHYER